MRLFYASFLAAENMSAYESVVDRLQAEVPRALRPIPAARACSVMASATEIIASLCAAARLSRAMYIRLRHQVWYG